MLNLSASSIVLIVAVSLFTAAAAFLDLRTKRIPNKLTLPMFFAGWVYQIIVSFMYGWEHLGSAALGFLVGFGLLFVLWFIGGGGGGDVKLMGALSVWLGLKMTLSVLFISTLLVLLATCGVVVWNITKFGMRRTREKYLATGKTPVGTVVRSETRDDKQKRRVMAYAGPVAVATWLVLIWNIPQFEQQSPSAGPAKTGAVQTTGEARP
ncbi:A24 family peptidase [Planctomicrobium piriforme]|uniref:Prepilin peptidase CpaA n=1 Tax=Planctomicrobium piriforme TaxID=1576369 RepID=A0A1I3P682_9PLAN|nr:A24 family peptidase [Planctomicrobium piriforme]SFJ16546.1 prepilin peptidase CpaA [Planctomicrobium piriforme]